MGDGEWVRSGGGSREREVLYNIIATGIPTRGREFENTFSLFIAIIDYSLNVHSAVLTFVWPIEIVQKSGKVAERKNEPPA